MNPRITQIETADRDTLLSLWQDIFGKPPPPHTHTSFLRHALAWAIQAGPKVTRKNIAAATPSRRTRPRAGHGTQYIREWQGRTFRVTVTPNGYDYGGKSWRSLSAIARDITGTRWSGPAFFGIKP